MSVYLEVACQLPKENVKIHPIGFRAHTHDMGAVVSGYKVNENKWTLIGKIDPQRPQAYYPVENPDMVVNGGEYLAARCTMVSHLKNKHQFHKKLFSKYDLLADWLAVKPEK